MILESGSGYGNGLNDINAEDIESISVLKEVQPLPCMAPEVETELF
jgi:hypothetical protein